MKNEKIERVIAPVQDAIAKAREDLAELLREATAEGRFAEARQMLHVYEQLETCSRRLSAAGEAPCDEDNRRAYRRLPRGKATPQAAFRLPVLRALASLGGRAHVREVLQKVEEQMRSQLNEVDREPLPSDPETPRWMNKACWERFEMVREGLLRGDSPRGVWELSDKGWQFLKDSEGAAEPES